MEQDLVPGHVQLASIDEQNPVNRRLQDEVIFQMFHPIRPGPNLPNQDLLREDNIEDYLWTCIPLYQATIQADWRAAEVILLDRPELVRYGITEKCETPLMVAASAKRTKEMVTFTINLMDMMEERDLELQDCNGNTAFCLAAAAGNIEMLKIMAKKNHMLPSIPGYQQMMPLYIASLFGNREAVVYLYDEFSVLRHDGWNPLNRGWLLLKCVEADLFDIATDMMLRFDPETATYGSVLGVLARKTDLTNRTKANIIVRTIRSVLSVNRIRESESDALELLHLIWESIVTKPKNEVDDILTKAPDLVEHDGKLIPITEKHTLDFLKCISQNMLKEPTEYRDIIPDSERTSREDLEMKSSGSAEKISSSHLIFVAAERGNTLFVVELIRLYYELIWRVNEKNESIFHVAIKHRYEGIYSLLYEIGIVKNFIFSLKDENDSNMLHLVGKKAKTERLQDVSGVALQMQQELLWFKNVEAMLPPSYREEKNKDGLTPHELFTEEHKHLVSEGEKWMKETASQCMVVAALIATIVFAAAFTVPGGYDQTNGIPNYHSKAAFLVFVLADALSLFSASSSILMFLSILTSRFAERDFLHSLPQKLVIGLATLFLSIASMMIAFSVSFFVLYHNNLSWLPIVIALFATMPVILFVTLQYPLLADLIRSTYGSKYLFCSKKLL